MALALINSIRLAGVASAVPASLWKDGETLQKFGAEEIRRISSATGIRERHVSTGSLCASDLCEAAAIRLLGDLGWEPGSIDLLVFLSQTPDHLVPATSSILHKRLGLSRTCAALDVSQACSGYVYGLWAASAMMAASGFRRGLLLVGDTLHRLTSPLDRATTLLFGDAGTATALTLDPTASGMRFALGTDGTGAANLMVPAGGFRHRRDASTARREPAQGGNERSAEDLFMDGGEIFSFTLREVPALITSLMEQDGCTSADVDAFLFHQASQLVVNHLAVKLKLPAEKVPLSLPAYGNTSSASIPLTMTTALRDKLSSGPRKLLMAGFGAGYSWGGCMLTCGPAACPEIILVPEKQAGQ